MDMTASAWRRSGLEPPPFERRDPAARIALARVSD
jgi:hypothetical protein